jgi:hypothetical protein
MRSVQQLAYWEGLILVGGLFGIVFWKVLTGGISLSGLLYGDRRDGGVEFSPGRVQLLIVTLTVGLYYLIQVIQNPTAFPDIPTSWLAALGGSQTVYLGGKARAMLFGKDGN